MIVEDFVAFGFREIFFKNKTDLNQNIFINWKTLFQKKEN